MKIQRVMVDGYKNLSDVNVTFGRMTSIVSINNLGKSNYLKGINFGIQFIKATPNQKERHWGCASRNKYCRYNSSHFANSSRLRGRGQYRNGWRPPHGRGAFHGVRGGHGGHGPRTWRYLLSK